MASSGRPPRSADAHLLSQMKKYAGWVSEGRVPAGSKVVPVQRALAALPWVIPTSQAAHILREAAVIALGDCVCRSHYRNCEAPLDVCLLFDAAAEKRITDGSGREVGVEEALAVLERGAEHGLVHLGLYSPDQPLLSLCSCCSCCCYQLGMLIALDRRDLVVKSDYVASLDASLCDGCGLCLEACHFGACVSGENPPGKPGAGATPRVRTDLCYGCGLCAQACPTGALSLLARAEVGAGSEKTG